MAHMSLLSNLREDGGLEWKPVQKESKKLIFSTDIRQCPIC